MMFYASGLSRGRASSKIGASEIGHRPEEIEMRDTVDLLIIAAVVIAAFCAQAQQDPIPLGAAIAAARDQTALQCDAARSPPLRGDELAEREREMGAAVFCDCMPAALDALERVRGARTLASATRSPPSSVGSSICAEQRPSATRPSATVRDSLPPMRPRPSAGASRRRSTR